jgi:hypothetical protein
MKQAQAPTTLGSKSLAVVTATESAQKTRGWARNPRPPRLLTNSQHRVAEATHMGLLDSAHSFEPSVHATGDVVQSIRVGPPVATR